MPKAKEQSLRKANLSDRRTDSRVSIVQDDPARAEVIASAIDRATNLVPFYKSWVAVDLGGSTIPEMRLKALPVLSKRDLRTRSHAEFVPCDRTVSCGLSTGEVEIVTTSGTTEDRVSIIWHQPWWDLSERESFLLNATTRAIRSGSQREAVLTTPLCAAAICHIGDLPIEQRTLGRILFLNQKTDPAYWTDADIVRMADEINAFQPEVLEADPAYLAQFSYRAGSAGLRILQPQHIFLTYEFPSRLHLRQIRRLFHMPPISSYGSTETGHVFTQCEHGMFHENTATCHVDLQPVRQPAVVDGLARILVTTLRNDWFSLVRFDVGDLARLASAPCPCGRTAGSTLESIEGRVRDGTFTPEGRLVTVNYLDRALGEVPGLLAYQIDQLTPTDYLMRFVAEPGLESQVSEIGLRVLRRVYGAKAVITAQRETALVPEPSGKYRLSWTRFAWDPSSLFA